MERLKSQVELSFEKEKKTVKMEVWRQKQEVRHKNWTLEHYLLTTSQNMQCKVLDKVKKGKGPEYEYSQTSDLLSLQK